MDRSHLHPHPLPPHHHQPHHQNALPQPPAQPPSQHHGYGASLTVGTALTPGSASSASIASPASASASVSHRLPSARRRDYRDDDDQDDDDGAVDADGQPKKKQKRNKPTLLCHECVERKTKVCSWLVDDVVHTLPRAVRLRPCTASASRSMAFLLCASVFLSSMCSKFDPQWVVQSVRCAIKAT